MAFLIVLALAVFIWGALREYQKTERRDKRRDVALQSRTERECREVALRANRQRDEAMRLEPHSQARLEKVAQARASVEAVKNRAGRHSFGVSGYEEMLSELESIERSSDRWISPRSRQVSLSGEVTVAFVDTETTGLSAIDEPITVGVVLAKIAMPKGQIIGDFEHLYETRQPGVPIHPRAQAVHGLSMRDLEGKAFNMTKIRAMVERADVLIAHNASFDRRMLARVMPDVAEWPWRCSYRQTAWPKDMPNRKLDTICGHFSVKRMETHNALADAKAMAECLLRPSGKTARSRTYLAACLAKPNLE